MEKLVPTGLKENGLYSNVGLGIKIITFVGLPGFLINGFHKRHQVDFSKLKLLSIPGGFLTGLVVSCLIGKTFNFNTVSGLIVLDEKINFTVTRGKFRENKAVPVLQELIDIGV
jgi:hypothetical protein